MKLGQMISKEFGESFAKLSDSVLVSGLFRFKGLQDFLVKEEKKYYEIRAELFNKYAELDESGRPLSDDKSQVIFKSKEDSEAFLKDIAQVHEQEVPFPPSVQISCTKHLREGCLTGRDAVLLGDCITD
jgi:hypothetical protein